MSGKYGVIIKQAGEASFTAHVVRRRTSRGTTIEREKAGFDSHDAAMAWGEAALAEYLAARKTRTANRKKARTERRSHEGWLETQTFEVLAGLAGTDKGASSVLKHRADLLWQEIAFRALKRGEQEHAAYALADKVAGKNWTQRLAKAASGDLDYANEAVRDMAITNARRLLEQGRDQCTNPHA